MSLKAFLARNLAAAFLAGPWALDELTERGTRASGGRRRWVRALARRVLTAFDGSAPACGPLADFIGADRGFARMWTRCQFGGRLPLHAIFGEPAAPAPWPVPALPTPAALAEWLGLSAGQLEWFADCRGRLAGEPDGPLRHYTYRWLAGRGGKRRLLEMPKQRLKALQRRVLRDVLTPIPPHDAAHGYRRGRSVVTYAAPHAAQDVVLHFDLRDFFPSVHAARVHAVFRAAGYPADVARLLTGLCTARVPRDVCQSRPGDAAGADAACRLYRRPHLPQGASTSPALANLCAYRLDRRLAGLARALGATYTRYADDLAFSGGPRLERGARRLQVLVGRVALEEGFEVHMRKTRFMRPGVRQQLAGVVLNAHPNFPRAEFDRLKAVLHNCAAHGPDTQNRAGRPDFRSHLAGRVAYVAMINPARGRKLRAIFARIRWAGG